MIRNGAVVRGFGLGADVSVGDLFAYRRTWEPFIAAHLRLWRQLNAGLESQAAAHCPPGIATDLSKVDPSWRSLCAALSVTRARISDTDKSGIPRQWNEWQGKTSAEILAGAPVMLKWHQDVVAKVGGVYKDELFDIARFLGVDIDLPPVPDISIQQNVIARLEGAYVASKGILQIAAYGAGTQIVFVADESKAIIEGLTNTVKSLPDAAKSPWPWIALTAVAAVVGGVLIYPYLPRPSHAR